MEIASAVSSGGPTSFHLPAPLLDQIPEPHRGPLDRSDDQGRITSRYSRVLRGIADSEGINTFTSCSSIRSGMMSL